MGLGTGFRIDHVICGQHILEVKRAMFSVAGGATGEVVAAVANKKLRVLYFAISSDTTKAELTWKSATDAISHEMYAPTGGMTAAPLTHGWFETAAGEALNLTNAAAGGAANGLLGYVEVPE